ncbi:unnamed protein product [Dibothriocephalus latus]|uniref:ZC3H15/TMA46 family C-terminal domain-containing protein n=1 Tax=Dibothriocephalus latus TaxID=60516 RepID=A0A3P6T887_DIBLA|nr:unnamed protein product [Dibothriocephalus latus]
MIFRHRRRALGLNQTKVTLQTFLAWKKRKRQEKIAAGNAERAKKEANFTQGRLVGISGREMFEFNPDFVNEGEEIDGDVCDSRLREEEEEEVWLDVEVRDIDLSAFDEEHLLELGDLAIDEDLFNNEDLEGLEEELEGLEVEP